MKTILFVDDEQNILELITLELEDKGYSVLTTYSGIEALDILSQKHVDLVVTNIKMFIMNGLELLKEIKANWHDIPVILYSACDSYKLDFATWDADEYVVKSSDVTELLHKVKKLIGDATEISFYKQLEDQARNHIHEANYGDAFKILLEIIKENPNRKQALQNELGFLFNFDYSSEQNEEMLKKYRGIVEWRTNLWSLICENNDFKYELLKTHQKAFNVIPIIETEQFHVGLRDHYAATSSAFEKGEELEKAVLRLFQEFFIISEKDESVILEKLRRQTSGLQFGYDLTFDCTIVDYPNVKCHIECKNKKDSLTLSDIADKLAQTDIFSPDIDHWILISPKANPNNELNTVIELWNTRRRYPFKIQVWCPDTQVHEFFGLVPEVFLLFYKPQDIASNPNNWSEIDRNNIAAKWRKKLEPLLRFPSGWEYYLREPYRICIKGEDTKLFESLYKKHVPLMCMDERKNIINKSAEREILKWLETSDTRFMFLLGEFGDGKTVFTYIIARRLIDNFIDDNKIGWIPIRFPLKDYFDFSNSHDFLKARLEEFGADIAGWNEITEKYNFLIILDGFDEMSRRLDSKTVTENIKQLIACCSEFDNFKIMITSRTHFFENQLDVDRLLRRLSPNWVRYLSPIDRKTNLEHLYEFASTPESKKKLDTIRHFHDPIGLASKPLFLEMIKETLKVLPEDKIDEIVLYETYINNCLLRKSKYLDDDDLNSNIYSIMEGIFIVLEHLALELQITNNNYYCLNQLKLPGFESIAEILWNNANSAVGFNEEEKEDALARVSTRSLLTRVSFEKTSERLVDFCHRSMREYFVARGLFKALKENASLANDLLSSLPLNYEILYFTGMMMIKEPSIELENNLMNIIQSYNSSGITDRSAGNAATLLFRYKGELPGTQWNNLNLDYAVLTGADLSFKNFSKSSLRYTSLNNINFEGTDLTYCDLSGSRIEETTSVLATGRHPVEDILLVSYSDNTIRKWDLKRSKNESKVIFQGLDKELKYLTVIKGGDIIAFSEEHIYLFDINPSTGMADMISCFVISPSIKLLCVKRDNMIFLYHDELIIYDISNHCTLREYSKPSHIIFGALDEGCSVIADKNVVWFEKDCKLFEIMKASDRDVTSVNVTAEENGKQFVIAIGHSNGYISIYKNKISQMTHFENIFEQKIHDSMISSLLFLDNSRVVSGSMDRKIAVTDFSNDITSKGTPPKYYYYSLRCRNMKIDNVKDKIAFEALSKYLDRIV